MCTGRVKLTIFDNYSLEANLPTYNNNNNSKFITFAYNESVYFWPLTTTSQPHRPNGVKFVLFFHL